MLEEQFLSRAQLLFEQKRYSEAEKDFGLVIAQTPSNSYVHSMLSLCNMNQGKFDLAERHANEAIGLSPTSSFAYYVASIVNFNLNKYSESKKQIKEAISLNPHDANYFGILASICLTEKEWQLALNTANEGLSLEPDNIECLNNRAKALIKLDKKNDAYETIKEALYFDPENSDTHSNLGWGLIEKGDHKSALHHFKEALSIDPTNENAKAGLIEALKARYWFYRIFLRYAFWIGNMKSKVQWAVIIGFYVGSRIVRIIGEKYPSLQIITTPLIVLYVLFALTTWIITPLSNLFLRLNVYGKYALNKDEIQCSNLVGMSLLLSIVSGIAFFIVGKVFLLLLCIWGFTMMIPISGIYNTLKKGRSRNILKFYAITIGLVGLLAMFAYLISGDATNTLSTIYLIGIIIYQWIANAILIK